MVSCPVLVTGAAENRPETPRTFYVSEFAQPGQILNRQSHEREPIDKDFSLEFIPSHAEGVEMTIGVIRPCELVPSSFACFAFSAVNLRLRTLLRK
jgi:hypothetical protein